MRTDDGGLNRRAFLATVTTSSMGMLAGCPACATSFATYDDRLRVTVARVGEHSGRFQVTIRAKQLGPGDYTGEYERERFQTTYDDVTVYAYDAERTELATASLGDFQAGTTETTELELDRLPFVLTAAAGEVSVNRDDCYFADTGAPVKGYLGEFDVPVVVASTPTNIREDAEKGTSGHRWARLFDRKPRNSVPPREWAFTQTKCLQRAARQVESIPAPELSALPDGASWYAEPIPEPTVRRQYRITVNRANAYNDGHADQFRTSETAIEFESLPSRVREAVRGDRSVGWVSESGFYELLSELAGHEMTAIEDELPCSETHVSCNDDRGVKCQDGKARFGGEFWKSVWYFTTYDDVEYVIVPNGSEEWLKPEVTTLGPCTDRRDESFAINVYDSEDRYRGLGSARTGVGVPAVLERVLENAKSRDPNSPSYYGQGVERSRWLDAVATLEGRDSGRIPDCEWSNVHCGRNPNVHCGEGRQKAFYVVEIDGESWWFALRYRWKGIEGTRNDG